METLIEYLKSTPEIQEVLKDIMLSKNPVKIRHGYVPGEVLSFVFTTIGHVNPYYSIDTKIDRLFNSIKDSIAIQNSFLHIPKPHTITRTPQVRISRNPTTYMFQLTIRSNKSVE